MSINRVGPWGRTGVTAGSALLLFASVVGLALAASLPPGGTFTDDDGNVHEANIEAIAAEGITLGCNPPVNDLYCPDQSVSREQMATFLTRALDLPAAAGSFTDTAGSVHEANIGALAAAGITLGCNPPTNDMFCPDAAVTRAQMATFLTRALDLPAAAGSFVDTEGSVHEANIGALAAAGITLGCNPPANDMFCPDESVTRAQMATFLTRALGLTPIVPPPTTSSTTTSTPSSTTTSTTLPGTDHPQSGDGWEFFGCSSPTGTCSYPQATTESQLRISSSLFPASYCVYDPITFGCAFYVPQWRFIWYSPGGSQVSPTSCTVSVGGRICSMPIAGAPLGEYRGKLCRTEYPSSTCVETLLTVYFNVTA
jgi:hypothetical protein